MNSVTENFLQCQMIEACKKIFASKKMVLISQTKLVSSWAYLIKDI